MASLQGELKRGFLRSLYRASKAKPLKLAAALDAFQDTKFQDIKAGRVIVSNSSNGHAASFRIPSTITSLSEENIFMLAEEFQAVYADSLITLSANSISNPSDAQIFDQMMADDRLQTITQTMSDYTMMRWSNRFSDSAVP